MAAGIGESISRFVSRGSTGLASRDDVLLQRFNSFTLIAAVGALYSVLFHLYVAGLNATGLALVAMDLAFCGAFLLNRALCLAGYEEHRRTVGCMHVLLALATLFISIPMFLSGRETSAIALYIVLAPAVAAYLLGRVAAVSWAIGVSVLIIAESQSDRFFEMTALMSFPLVQAQITFVIIITLIALAARRTSDRQVDMIEAMALVLSDQNQDLERQGVEVAAARDGALAESVSQRARFEAGFENSPIGLALLGNDGCFQQLNPALSRLLGYRDGTLVGTTFASVTHPEDVASDAAALDDLRSGRKATYTTDNRYVTANGELVWARLSVAALEDSYGNADGFFSQILDITGQKAIEVDLEWKANHDGLTGLANRFRFVRAIGDALDALKGAELDRDHVDEMPGHERAGDEPGSGNDAVVVLFVDVDQFKILNDSLGHEVGDQLLVEIGARLRQRLTGRDVLAAARLGGDEFAVVANVPSGAPGAPRELADRVHRLLREPFVLDGKEISSTVSIGISQTSDPSVMPLDLLRHADAAMYQAKAQGRATTRVFDLAMRDSLDERFELVRALSSALERGELRLFYQPEVDLATTSIVGVEALLRWDHPSRGLLTAAEFITIAEETGLIVSIGAWALGQAIHQAARWPMFDSGRRLVTRINLSANQIVQDDLVEIVRGLLADAEIDPSEICFELTETSLIETGEVSMTNLNGLRALGVQLAIDDFGTGYSSFTYLKQIPATALKIDLSFVQGLLLDERDRHIVRSIIALARDLQFDVVAEGVESEDQAALLSEYACPRAQGYLWHRPMPPEAVLELLVP